MSPIKSFERLNTKKFLRTDLEEHLKHDSGRCIGCQECMKRDNKLISYKYNKGIQSVYMSQFQNDNSGNKKEEPFNYDKERQNFKVNYSPPKDFTTISMSTYKPY